MTIDIVGSKYDNGGAEAIKGFNFQKANLILLAVNNFHKKDFKIYIEAEDDIVVSYEDYKAYIQVKKQVHTFNTITKQKSKKSKDSSGNEIKVTSPSILEKNLKSGTKEDTFKIIVKDIGERDKKQLNIKKPGSIFSELYELSGEAKDKIIQFLPDELIDKLDKFYFVISPIHENLKEAEKYLIGCLNAVGVSVDNNRGRTIIAELCLTIDQKAQEIITDEIHKELKAMDTNYFSKVLITYESLKKFDDILESFGYNEIIKRRIKKERLKIELSRSELKDDIKKVITEYTEHEDIINITDKEIIDYVLDKFKSKNHDNITLIATAIESLCELGDELSDY